MALHNITINKTWSTKNQENCAQPFGDNYLTDDVVKFLQAVIKPLRVEALEVCTGYHFLKRKFLVRSHQRSLTFRVVHINNSHEGLLC